MASLASVRACADALMATGDPFDLVVANAGVMACPKGTTADGFETQFGTNHLGHFVFVNRIASLLKSACASSRAFLGLTDAVEKSGFLLSVAVFRLRCDRQLLLKQT